jgi:hypothetical protein
MQYGVFLDGQNPWTMMTSIYTNCYNKWFIKLPLRIRHIFHVERDCCRPLFDCNGFIVSLKVAASRRFVYCVLPSGSPGRFIDYVVCVDGLCE